MDRTAKFAWAGVAAVIGAAALRVATAPVTAAGNSAAMAAISAPQQGVPRRDSGVNKAETPQGGGSGRKTESKLTLLAARPAGASSRSQPGQGRRTVSYPLEFRAGASETVGAIRALVTLPGPAWKFVKAELPPGSPLKVSSRQEKKDKDRKGNPAETIELNFTAGARAIRDGIIADLQFSVPAASASSGEPPAGPALILLTTAPPQTEQVRNPEEPMELPPAPPANPSVSCFFFSH